MSRKLRDSLVKPEEHRCIVFEIVQNVEANVAEVIATGPVLFHAPAGSAES